MDVKMIHSMLEKIVECAKCELETQGIDNVNTKEFSQVADIIKDLSESLYYRTVTVAMEEAERDKEYEDDEEDYDWEDRKGYNRWRYSSGRFAPKGRGSRRGYEGSNSNMTRNYEMTRNYDMGEMERDRMREMERMRDMDRGSGRMYYTEPGRSDTMAYTRDSREGRSGMMRKSYMDTKDLHRGNSAEDKQHKMKSLEDYTRELADDVTQMIEGATPEEKNLLRTKLQTLSQKIQ